MGKNTFTISFDDGTTASKSVTIAEPRIIRGWWSSDREGNNNLKETQLSETVFFHIETKGIAEGKELELKLYDRDYHWQFTSNPTLLDSIINLLDRDDDEFPDEEIVEKATVFNTGGKSIAILEILLSEKWESVIKDDIEKVGGYHLDNKIELYWEVKYGKKINEKILSELKVGFSDKTLYFKSPVDGHNLPELISYDGSPLVLMKLGGGMIKGQVKSKIGKAFGKSIDNAISHIALTKMEKGIMVANTGKLYTNASNIYARDIYTNDGTLLKDVKQRKPFGFNDGGVATTTKGISQYDYHATEGKRVKVLGLLKEAGHFLDFASLLSSAQDGFDTSKPLSIPMGPLSPINDLAGVLIQQYSDDLEETLERVVQDELAEAKEKGLKGVQSFVYNNRNSKKDKYNLLAISAETANKLLQGEFKTIDELNKDVSNSLDDKEIYILYREVRNKNRKEDIYIIETIFLNK
ncbi:MAG: hypothetical protein ACERIH_10485 [Labilibaculum antarcticum]